MSGVRAATATPVLGDVSDVDPEGSDPQEPTTRRPLWGRDGVVIAALLAVLSLPLVVATAVMSSDRWYPVLDLAMTELRLRDVGGSHTPLIGFPRPVAHTPAPHGTH